MATTISTNKPWSFGQLELNRATTAVTNLAHRAVYFFPPDLATAISDADGNVAELFETFDEHAGIIGNSLTSSLLKGTSADVKQLETIKKHIHQIVKREICTTRTATSTHDHRSTRQIEGAEIFMKALAAARWIIAAMRQLLLLLAAEHHDFVSRRTRAVECLGAFRWHVLRCVSHTPKLFLNSLFGLQPSPDRKYGLKPAFSRLFKELSMLDPFVKGRRQRDQERVCLRLLITQLDEDCEVIAGYIGDVHNIIATSRHKIECLLHELDKLHYYKGRRSRSQEISLPIGQHPPAQGAPANSANAPISGSPSAKELADLMQDAPNKLDFSSSRSKDATAESGPDDEEGPLLYTSRSASAFEHSVSMSSLCESGEPAGPHPATTPGLTKKTSSIFGITKGVGFSQPLEESNFNAAHHTDTSTTHKQSSIRCGDVPLAAAAGSPISFEAVSRADGPINRALVIAHFLDELNVVATEGVEKLLKADSKPNAPHSPWGPVFPPFTPNATAPPSPEKAPKEELPDTSKTRRKPPPLFAQIPSFGDVSAAAAAARKISDPLMIIPRIVAAASAVGDTYGPLSFDQSVDLGASKAVSSSLPYSVLNRKGILPKPYTRSGLRNERDKDADWWPPGNKTESISRGELMAFGIGMLMGLGFFYYYRSKTHHLMKQFWHPCVASFRIYVKEPLGDVFVTVFGESISAQHRREEARRTRTATETYDSMILDYCNSIAEGERLALEIALSRGENATLLQPEGPPPDPNKIDGASGLSQISANILAAPSNFVSHFRSFLFRQATADAPLPVRGPITPEMRDLASRAFENEVSRHPLRSFLFGNLVQLATISLQRTVSDMDQLRELMVDHLERNQLSLRILATMPPLAFCYTLYTTVFWLWKQKKERRKGPQRRLLRSLWRAIHQRLCQELHRQNPPFPAHHFSPQEFPFTPSFPAPTAAARPSHFPTDAHLASELHHTSPLSPYLSLQPFLVSTRTQGFVLILAHELRQAATNYFFKTWGDWDANELAEGAATLNAFLEDIGEIESIDATVQQRLCTLQRMATFYPVLHSSPW